VPKTIEFQAPDTLKHHHAKITPTIGRLTMGSETLTDALQEKLAIGKEFDNKRSTVDQLKRQYGLLGLCGLALNIDNAWIALGGSVTIAIGAILPQLSLKHWLNVI
jgi:hypothetical protein